MPRRRRPTPTACALLTASACALAACTNLDEIDRRTNALVADESGRIDGGSLAPEIVRPDPEAVRSPDQHDEKPATVNPAADRLQYDQAAADRDVAARLEQYAEVPDDALVLDLGEAFRVFQDTGREYITAREEYILSAIRLLQERHRWSPRFFNDTSLDVDGTIGDPDVEIPLRIMNELRVTQRLPYGGEVEARAVFQATEQLREAATDDYVQSTDLIFEANVPLLRGAGLVAREELIQRERDVVYAARTFERRRRELLFSIASDYFNLVNQRDQINNQIRSIDSRRQSVERTQAEVEAGRRRALEIRQQQQALLQAEDSLVSLRESYLVSLDRFKIRLGVPVETPVVIERSAFDLPDPAASPGEASLLALRYRLDLQNERDQLDDARRNVSNARNELLPDLNLSGAVSVDTPDSERIGSVDFEYDRPDFAASVTFGLPLDREIERLNVRSTVINLQRAIRGYEQFRDNVILDARSARRRIDQQRFSVQLNERRVENVRLQIEELKLRDDADPFDLTQSEDDLLAAENDLAEARQDLRTQILNYLLTTGQLRVTMGGRFQPLPGMGQVRGEGSDAGGEGGGRAGDGGGESS